VTITPSEIEDKIKNLCVLPVVVTDALGMLDREDVDFVKIQQKIAQDIGLSSRLLSVANSAFYGNSGKIRTIKEACMILGTYHIKHLLLSTAVMEQFSSNKQNNVDFRTLWQHSYGTGIAAGILAEHLSQDRDIAYIAGLLHDIGKMVLDICFVDKYAEVLSYMRETGCLCIEAERHCLATDHAVVGHRLLVSWKFPGEITQCIAFHHTPQQRSTPLPDIVHLANAVSKMAAIGLCDDAPRIQFSNNAMQRLDLDMDTVEQMIPRIQQEMAKTEIPL